MTHTGTAVKFARKIISDIMFALDDADNRASDLGDIPINQLHYHTLPTLRRYHQEKLGYTPPTFYSAESIINVIYDMTTTTGDEQAGLPLLIATAAAQSAYVNIMVDATESTTSMDNFQPTLEQTQNWLRLLLSRVRSWRSMNEPLRPIANHARTSYQDRIDVLQLVPPNNGHNLVTNNIGANRYSKLALLVNPVVAAVRDSSDPKFTIGRMLRDLGYLADLHYNDVHTISQEVVVIGFDLAYYYNVTAAHTTTSTIDLHSEWSRMVAWYLYRLTNEQLLLLLGVDYTGPRDRASLLFTAHTSQITANSSYKEERLAAAGQLSLHQTAWLVANFYSLVNTPPDSGIRTVTAIGPCRFLAGMTPPIWAQWWHELTPENARSTAQRIGVQPPLKLLKREHSNDIHSKLKLLYYVDVWLYLHGQDIYFRAPHVQLQPALNATDVRAQWSYFTDREIAQYYGLSTLATREFLWELLITDPEMWVIGRYLHATNLDDNNVETLEARRSELSRSGQLVLSYGTLNKYQSWSVDELLYTFAAETDGGYLFRNPSGRDRHQEFFSTGTIKMLAQLLRDVLDTLTGEEYIGVVGQSYASLLALVEDGLSYRESVLRRITLMRRQYRQASLPARALMSLYVFWLFTFGQYTRFWKGPGYPYQARNINYEYLPIEQQEAAYCTPTQRNLLTSLQLTVYQTILYNLSLLPDGAAAVAWVRNIPLLSFVTDPDDVVDDEPGIIIVRSDNLRTMDDVLTRAGNARLCLMFTSDITIEISFILSSRVLLVSTIDEFNQLLRSMLPILRSIERAVVQTRIAELEGDVGRLTAMINATTTTDPRRTQLLVDRQTALDDDVLVALHERLVELMVEPMPLQEDFDPENWVITGEVDIEPENELMADE